MGDVVPCNATEAMKDPNWEAAMRNEHDSLVANKVWELVPLPTGRAAIGGKWHFVVKRGADGNISKYKARYVDKDFN